VACFINEQLETFYTWVNLNLPRSVRTSDYTALQIGDVEGYLSINRTHVIIVNGNEDDFVSLKAFARYSC
jgi:hypothetical protein